MSEQELAFSGWDKNLDLKNTKQVLQEHLTVRDKRKKAFFAILLVQLLNGSRVGEAVLAMRQWAEDGKKEQRVRVEKRKDKFMRLMIIPKEVRKSKQLKEWILNSEYMDLTDAVIQFSRRHLNWNTHALRYAFISDMSEDTQPQVIAKLTGQKSLDMILRYTSTRKGEQKLRERIE